MSHLPPDTDLLRVRQQAISLLDALLFTGPAALNRQEVEDSFETSRTFTARVALTDLADFFETFRGDPSCGPAEILDLVGKVSVTVDLQLVTISMLNPEDPHTATTIAVSGALARQISYPVLETARQTTLGQPGQPEMAQGLLAEALARLLRSGTIEPSDEDLARLLQQN